MKQMFAMMMGVLLGVLLLAAPAFAHDADGKWTGMIDTPMGAIPVGFEFKADGDTLTGTSLAPDGGALAIKNGKVDGNNISFSVDIDFGGMAVTLNYVGIVSPQEIKFTGDFMGCRSSSPSRKRSRTFYRYVFRIPVYLSSLNPVGIDTSASATVVPTFRTSFVSVITVV